MSDIRRLQLWQRSAGRLAVGASGRGRRRRAVLLRCLAWSRWWRTQRAYSG